ncbi:hypothetical protein HHK36_012089 [Tetracentron sinense]|uniref:DUF6821 domain-containing protein n=1 Tax=Tetracentron sinense TaxID=13715 RepID=A0A834ZAS5_TETSI|nr:hypothetical protein HHK36_012089 [Tetracentron sinense]
MEKASDEMDLDEWEFLSDDGFHHHVDSGKRLSPGSGIKTRVLETPKKNSSVSSAANQLVHVPIQLEQKLRMIHDHELVNPPSVILEKFKAPNLGGVTADQDAQIFFKNTKENEFVDMKMESPKSSSRGINPQIEEKEETSPRVAIEQEIMDEKNYLDSKCEEQNNWEGGGDHGGLSIWRWRLTGIGALCSIGVTAATVCIFIFGSHQRHKHHQHNQKLLFQINNDDKEINQALSAVRGVPLARTHMTFEAYHDGL